MKTKIERILRCLDRGYLRLTNLVRPTPLGYVEHTGTIRFEEGRMVIEGWSIDCLGKGTGIDLSGPTLKLAGWDTGVVSTPVTFAHGEIQSNGPMFSYDPSIETLRTP